MPKENQKKLVAQIIPAVRMPRNMAQFFSYLVPEKMAKEIKIGSIVEISLRNKSVLGIVYEIQSLDTEKINYKLKEIKNVLNGSMRLSKKHIQLLEFVSTYYYSPLSLVAKLALPPITKKDARKNIELNTNCTIQKIEKNLTKKFLLESENKEKILLIHNMQSEKQDLYSEIIKGIVRQAHYDNKNNKSKSHLLDQVLLLVPEYFDIYNFANFYKEKFGMENVAIITSELTKNQYFQQWKKIKDGSAQIIIGTRQVIFAPFQNLKLIICDDEHNSSYKQWDQNPRYHGIKVAQKLAEIWKAKIILSSPAPSVESYHLTENDKRFSKIELIAKKENYQIEKINMENERKTGNHSALSEKLKTDLLGNIYKKKQAVIFIPRLGKNTITKCRDCEYIAECKNCENILIMQNNHLYCTRCKEKSDLIKQCPKCQGQRMSSFGYGSEEIQNEIEKLFEGKNIKIVRLDSNTVSEGSKQTKIQTDFVNGKIGILLGTQMVLKNWNMKNISTIGILFPEIIFNQAEFKSKEKTVQFLKFISILSNKNQKVILQTNDIENKMFLYLKKDLNAFYKEEIENRKLPSGISYPPFSQLIKLIYKNQNQFQCQREAENMYKIIKNIISENEILKENFQITTPFAASSFIEYGKYRWNIIIKSKCKDIKLRDSLLELIGQDWIIDIDPDNIS
ncbi:MAG: primosomal protein N' [Candidatus Pacebacteria bacterium]|nr:primosomal protein N' [Candidatus Paceibacterota bacterium]